VIRSACHSENDIISSTVSDPCQCAENALGMTLNKHSEHALPSTSTSVPNATMSSKSWVAERSRLLKKYRTQVASAVSTICAYLAVVSGLASVVHRNLKNELGDDDDEKEEVEQKMKEEKKKEFRVD
jgi:hypothetical protein